MLVGDPGSGKRLWRCNLLRIQLCHIYPVHMYVLIKNQKNYGKAIQMDGSVNDSIQSGSLKFVEISIQEWDPEQSINELLLTIQLQVDAFVSKF